LPEFDIESGTRRPGGKKIANALLAGASISDRQKRRIHARQSDQIAKQLFSFKHPDYSQNGGKPYK
jgi:hypothetical protein